MERVHRVKVRWQKKTKSLADQILAELPAGSLKIEAGLVFAGGQIFFYDRKNGGKFSFKGVSPNALRLAFAERNEDSGWLTPNIVRFGKSVKKEEWFALWLPPQKQLLTIVADDQTSGNYIVPLPGMIYLASEQKAWLWAVRELEFEPKAFIYYPPLPNINDDLTTCLGTNARVTAKVGKAYQGWWDFVSSPFNGHNTNNRHTTSGDIRAVLKELAQSETPRYPVKDLYQVVTRDKRPVNSDDLIDALINPSER